MAVSVKPVLVEVPRFQTGARKRKPEPASLDRDSRVFKNPNVANDNSELDEPSSERVESSKLCLDQVGSGVHSVEDGRAFSADAATLQTAPEQAEPTQEQHVQRKLDVCFFLAPMFTPS